MTSSSGTIISTYSWEEYYSPPALRTYIQMELILHVLACLADLTDQIMLSMAHNESIGCLFDFCRQKSDVRFKIIGGHICGICSGKLREYGLQRENESVVSRLLDSMRLDSIGRAKKIKVDNVFVAMQFSENDENANSFIHGVMPAFKNKKFEVTRADSIAGDDNLVEKIFKMIDEAWAVVVMCCNFNLNVFFEYGYAVGQNKPIFVVVPQSKINEIPTDIKGFEHIVYKDGNFQQLEKLLTDRLASLARFSAT